MDITSGNSAATPTIQGSSLQGRTLTRLIFTVIVAVFVIELVIMLALHAYLPDLSSLSLGLIDSVALVIALVPTLYLLFVRPLVQIIAKREQSLVDSEQKYRDLTETTSDWIWEVNQNAEYTYSNPSISGLLGYSPEEILGKTPFHLMPEKEAKRVAEIFGPIAEARKPFSSLVNTNVHRDGHEIVLETNAVPVITPEGDFLGYRGIDRDVTERTLWETQLKKTSAELARSNEELQQFAFVASHDLQEPLRMISSYVQLLEKRYKGKLDSDADEFIEFAVSGTVRMKEMINDLLAYSRVGTRLKPLKSVDVEQVLDGVLANLDTAISESDASITRDDLPTVIADSSQLAQLFQNLVSNAIKFRSDRPLKILISARRDSDEWVFSVSDNGIGIKEKHVKRIFAIFQTLHGKGEYQGTGIGLAVCQRIVERHGGRIWVESEPGKGSTFYFTIPDEVGEEHAS